MPDELINRGREVVRRLCGIPANQPADDARLKAEFSAHLNSKASEGDANLTDADDKAISEWLRAIWATPR